MEANTPEELGARIVDARKQHGWTQAELADRAGVSRRWIIDVESGHRERAELSRIFRVLRTLNLTFDVRERYEQPIDPAVSAHLQALGVL